MATFLNREGILKHFSRIFAEAKSELIMVVPFIKLTTDVKEQFRLAKEREIQILIVYRENNLSNDQKEILFSFDNVTILHHPNVHTKCYLNERSLIICSMNLYDVSMKNNREMGVLLDYFNEVVEEKNTLSNSIDDSKPLEEAIEEIKLILNSSKIEKASNFIKQNGFKFNVLKNRKDLIIELISDLNKISGNKRFELIPANELYNSVICQNYFENVDLKLDLRIGFNENNLKAVWVNRVELRLTHPEKQLEKLYSNFGNKIKEFTYKYYKTYWNWHNTPIMIYRNQKQFPEIWDQGDNLKHILGLIKGADRIIQDLKKEKLFLRVE